MTADGDGSLGSSVVPDRGTRFLVWAPHARKVEVHLVAPAEMRVGLGQRDRGYHEAIIEDVGPGCLYYYRLDDGPDRPDPASRFQPQGVHGPSQVVSPEFGWEDSDWTGLPLDQYVLYELHVGTFTPEGTFDAIIPLLKELKGLGITAIELMPVGQFPGDRNWGYDGAYPFAAQNSYGGPEGLKRLVNGCHREGVAVVLDVVYNHLGPEGNYLRDFGPYFSDRYVTAWGPALNFDGAQSDEVRRFFLENAFYWLTEFHIDAFRLDAADEIIDHSASARPFLAELAEAVQRRAGDLNRRVYVVGETALNDTRLVRPRELGGYGLDAQWNDEFHHALHCLLTGEDAGYYQDFGKLEQLAKAFSEGFIYSGQYSPFRQRRHGMSSKEVPACRFVVFRQNHDQVGNRVYGRRLARLVSFEGVKVAVGAVLLSPYIPLLFMGEEYGETAPFLYFTSHSDPDLIEAVRRGRLEEFSAFEWPDEPPDPQDEATFIRSKLDRSIAGEGPHRALMEFYRELIGLRGSCPALSTLRKDQMEVLANCDTVTLFVRRWHHDDQMVVAFNFSGTETSVNLPFPAGRWQRLMDSAEERWQGPGSAAPESLESTGSVTVTLRPYSFALFGGGRST